MKKILPLLLLLSMPFQCLADSVYTGIDYMLTDIELSGESAKPNSSKLRIGVSNNNMAFEAQYLISNNTDNIYRMEFDIEKSVVLYFVMQSGIVDGFGLDASLGYAMTDIMFSGPEETLNGKEQYKGFSWEIAIHQQIPYLKQAQARLSYQSLYKDSDSEITGISLGFTYQF